MTLAKTRYPTNALGLGYEDILFLLESYLVDAKGFTNFRDYAIHERMQNNYATYRDVENFASTYDVKDIIAAEISLLRLSITALETKLSILEKKCDIDTEEELTELRDKINSIEVTVHTIFENI